MKLKIGVPYAKHGRVTEETLKSLNDLVKSQAFETEVVFQQGSNVPRARNTMINGEQNNLVSQKLEGFDYFLCVDADTGFTVDHVKQLVAHDLPIVSGAYPHKHDTTRHAAGWFREVEGISPMHDRVEIGTTGLIEVDWVGAGFLLLQREALERMPYPWFTCIEVEYDTPNGPCAQISSDDLGFCIKAKRHGETIMLDADCVVDHVAHPNENASGNSLAGAINDLLQNRETIIRHVKAMADENKRLKAALQSSSGQD